MIKIVFNKEQKVYCPTIICDACQKSIENARMAVAIFPMNSQDTDVIHAHKGACHKYAEDQMLDGFTGWIELSEHLYYLFKNSGLGISDFKRVEKSKADKTI